MDAMSALRKTRVIAIARNLEKEHMLALACALCEGGVNMLEVTFSQANRESWIDTRAAIELISRAFAGRICVGAGTVMTEDQLIMARDAGAMYMVSPNVNPAIIQKAKSLGMAAFPGAMTPTECAMAHDAGADAVKLFPATFLGVDYIKAIRAPLSHINFLAVGGVNVSNARAFIDAGCVGIGVGGNLVSRDIIASGDTGKITALAREYIKAVN